MNRICFLVSHLASDWKFLADSLNHNPRIQISDLDVVYQHPSDLDELLATPHKLNNTAAIYGDSLLFNSTLAYKGFYNFCNFVYLIRSPKATLNIITESDSINYSRYYIFRIRRIYEMARQTPGAVMLTWDDLNEKKGLDLIESYLKLKEPLEYPELPKNLIDKLPSNQIADAEECYEEYLYRMKNLDLRLV